MHLGPARAEELENREAAERIIDFLDLSSDDPQERIDSVLKLAKRQKAEFIEVIKERIDQQKDENVSAAFQEGLYILRLKHGTPEQQLQAVKELGESTSFGARDFIEDLRSETEDSGIKKAAVSALKRIDAAQKRLDFYSSLVHGLSTGSVSMYRNPATVSSAPFGEIGNQLRTTRSISSIT